MSKPLEWKSLVHYSYFTEAEADEFILDETELARRRAISRKVHLTDREIFRDGDVNEFGTLLLRVEWYGK